MDRKIVVCPGKCLIVYSSGPIKVLSWCGILGQQVCCCQKKMNKISLTLEQGRMSSSSTGTFSWLRLRMKRCDRIPYYWCAQAFRALGLTLSGPTTPFLVWSLQLSLPLTARDRQAGSWGRRVPNISWCGWRQRSQTNSTKFTYK